MPQVEPRVYGNADVEPGKDQSLARFREVGACRVCPMFLLFQMSGCPLISCCAHTSAARHARVAPSAPALENA